MSTKIEKHFSIDAAPDRVMAAMRDPEQIKESELSRDALSVRTDEVSKDETKHEYVVNVVSHARTITGIDKSKTETNKTRLVWNLRARTATWTWTGEHSMVKIGGTYALREEGAGTSLTLTADINVAIPLAGRTVEKKIAAGFESEWPNYVARVGRYAKKP
jgi:carbon monoxide dehydrogenase subunit G